MVLQCILWIANSSYAVKTPKDEVTCYILELLQKIENLEMFPSKREILRSNGRTGDNLSKWDSPAQNGRIDTYENILYINILGLKTQVLLSLCYITFINISCYVEL